MPHGQPHGNVRFVATSTRKKPPVYTVYIPLAVGERHLCHGDAAGLGATAPRYVFPIQIGDIVRENDESSSR